MPEARSFSLRKGRVVPELRVRGGVAIPCVERKSLCCTFYWSHVEIEAAARRPEGSSTDPSLSLLAFRSAQGTVKMLGAVGGADST
jgi:hypothetical protein